MELNNKFELMTKIAASFSPSAPIEGSAFAGRESQITDVMNACAQRGQHVVIFGERGAGKTSLANTLHKMLKTHFVTPACGTINCDQTTTFASLWRAMLSEIPISRNTPAIGFRSGADRAEGTLAQRLPENVTPDSVRAALQDRGKLLFIIDEIDRIKDKTTTTLLADTVKNLSDHAVDTTLILVGVSESVETLIAEHESVQRALIQVHLPRMSQAEIDKIIDDGLAAVGMTIEQNAKKRIYTLSQGLPHYAHLLGMHSALTATAHDRRHIIIDDAHEALRKTLKNAPQSIALEYERATMSAGETLHGKVLLACALTKTDEHGYFTGSDVQALLSTLTKRDYMVSVFSQHLNAFCENHHGLVLHRTSIARGYKYKFRNALMQPYVLMKALESKLIS